jgi:hypothetical protein
LGIAAHRLNVGRRFRIAPRNFDEQIVAHQYTRGPVHLGRNRLAGL